MRYAGLKGRLFVRVNGMKTAVFTWLVEVVVEDDTVAFCRGDEEKELGFRFSVGVCEGFVYIERRVIK